MKCDVVIPLSNGSRWDNNELRYCLRSLEKYFLPLGEVYIMTPLDLTWIQHAHVINVGDPLKSNKDGNLINKVLHACRMPELSRHFLRLSDDQLLLGEISDISQVEPYFLFNLKETSPRWWSGKWKARMRRTMDYLTLHGMPAFHYDTHCPQIYDKQEFLRIWEAIDFESNIGYCINTMYFNHQDPSGKKILNGVKANMESAYSPDKLARRLEGKIYLGYSDAGLTDHLKAFLADMFPDKSKFEK